jgi:hypothetical protein
MMSNDATHDADRAWDLRKKIGFAMLVTRDENAIDLGDNRKVAM